MYKNAIGYLKKYKIKVGISMLLSLIGILFELIQVDFTKEMIESALVGSKSKVLYLLSLFIVIGMCKLIRGFLNGYLINYINTSVHKDLNYKFVERVSAAEYEAIDELTVGEMLSRHNSDINKVTQFISSSYNNSIFSLLLALCGLIYLLTINWKLCIIGFAITPIFTVLIEKFSNRSGKLYTDKMHENDQGIEHIKSVIDGNEFYKTYNLQEWIQKKGMDIFKRQYIADTRYIKNDAYTLSMILCVNNLPSIFIYLFGTVLVVQGDLTLAGLFAFIQLAKKINAPSVNMFTELRNLKEAFSALKRIEDVLLLKEERTNGEQYICEGETAISVKEISYGYEKTGLILDNISLEIPQNKCIGIVGKSGQGKSSLIDLLCGFHSCKTGKIMMFGHEINEWNLENLRSNISLVSQNTYLFPATVMENIRYGKLDATDEEIIKAAKMVGADKFIVNMEKGYQTILANNGAGLSGGEKQRIAFARAILKNANILLLDEPTSALDMDTETDIIEALVSYFKGKTVIIVSHRLSLIKHCDWIYVLEAGSFVEEGTNHELLGQKGVYYNLFQQQL